MPENRDEADGADPAGARQPEDFEAAASRIVERYEKDLIRLARSGLSPALAGRVDAADCVQSGFGSYFRRARRGELPLDGEAEIWSLLAEIVRHKVLSNARRHSALKRSVSAEQYSLSTPQENLRIVTEALSREPTPAEVCEAQDELRAILEDLPPLHRRILLLRLDGHLPQEIALQVGCASRTVHRTEERCRELLKERRTQLP